MLLGIAGLNHLITLAGNVLRLRYYTETIGSVWDDDRTLTASGNSLYISGLVQDLKGNKGSQDAMLMEEGRLRYGDVKMFFTGSIETSSGIKAISIAISGAAANEVVYYQILPGTNTPLYAGQNVYKSVYLRELQGGSLF